MWLGTIQKRDEEMEQKALEVDRRHVLPLRGDVKSNPHGKEARLAVIRVVWVVGGPQSTLCVCHTTPLIQVRSPV